MIISTKLPRAGYWLLLVLAMALLPIKVLADCSAEYMGLATINELSDKEQFIEVKILSSTIDSSIYSGWSLDFCSTDGKKNNPTVQCAFNLPLSGAGIDTDGEPWLVRRGLGGAAVDLAGMDVRLKDAEGRTIDYVRVGPGAGDARVPDPDCDGGDLPYDSYLPPVSGQAGQFARRLPDGTGDWSMATGASDGKSTDSDTNDETATGPAINVYGDGVFAGDTAVFRVGLPSGVMASRNIQIQYQTENNTAVAPEDYEARSGSVTLDVDTNDVYIRVPTNVDSDFATERFYLRVTGVSYGIPESVIAVGEIWPATVGWWSFENGPWDSAGEVLDRSGNDLHGSEFGGVISLSDYPARPGDPGTCQYAGFAGGLFSSDYIDVPDSDLLDRDESVSVAAWVKPIDYSPWQRSTILSKGRNYALHISNGGDVQWQWSDSSGNSRTLTTSSEPVPEGAWTHVAVTHRSGEQLIYVNGQVVEQSSVTGGLATDNSSLRFGNDHDWVSLFRYFYGVLDEIRVYSTALPGEAVEKIYQSRHPCGSSPTLDRLVISAPAAASVCGPVSVRLAAYDGNGSLFDNYAGTVSLSTSSNHGRWESGAGEGVLSPDPDSTDDGNADYQFVSADNGEAVLAFTNTHADEMVFTAVDQDTGISARSDPVTFAENVLYIETVDALGDDLIAGRTHAYQVSLLKRDSDSTECDVATDYDGIYSLKAWLDRTAEDPGGLSPELDSSEDSVTAPSAQPTSNNFAVGFDAGTGKFTLTPPDVGRYTLNLLDDTSGFVQDLNGEPLPIISASANAPWTARPFAISVEAVGNPGAVDASGPVYRMAAEEFSLRVGGRLYDNADDGNGDGIADAGADLLDNGFAPSFGREGEQLVFGHELLAPDPANATGELYAPDIQAADFSNGLAEKAGFRFDEVGIIDINGEIEDGDYLGAGAIRTNRIVITSGPVGRFKPAYFDIIIDPGVFSSRPLPPQNRTTCTGGGERSWVYTGEPFGWKSEAEIVIAPKNMNDAAVENYRGTDFQFLEASDVAEALNSFPVDEKSKRGVGGDPLQLHASLETISEFEEGEDGALVYTYGSGDTFRYPKSRDARVDGYIPNPIFTLKQIEDEDGVTAQNPSEFFDKTFEPAADNDFKIRYGRITLENSYGPEDMELVIPLKAEIFGDEGFELHEAETCWFYNLAEDADPLNFDDSALEDGQSNVLEVDVSDLQLADGRPEDNDYRLRLSAPDPTESEDPQQKGIKVQLDAGVEWLKDYWDADNPNDLVNPYAWATFGVYRGNDRIIYWREVQD